MRIITSILQMPRIISCSDVSIDFQSPNDKTKLPIDAISSWLHHLHRTSDSDISGMEICGRKKNRRRFLRISFPNIQNAREMCKRFSILIKLQLL